MTGKQHALKILFAIQDAEANGFQVVIEDGVWELETDD